MPRQRMPRLLRCGISADVMLEWRSIVYDAGTSAESYEWLTVNSCAPDELRILDEKVNVLEIPKPPTAQVRL